MTSHKRPAEMVSASRSDSFALFPDADQHFLLDRGPGQGPRSNHHESAPPLGVWPEAYPVASGQEPGLYV